MNKINYRKIIEESINESNISFAAEQIPNIGEYAGNIILRCANNYNPKDLSIYDLKWFLGLLSMIDIEAITIKSTNSNIPKRIGEIILEIKNKFIIPNVEKYRKNNEK